MSDLTILRYWAAEPEPYLRAIVRLIAHARGSTDDFDFGPLRLRDCVRDGLCLVGPDLTGPTMVLATVPGLVLVEA